MKQCKKTEKAVVKCWGLRREQRERADVPWGERVPELRSRAAESTAPRGAEVYSAKPVVSFCTLLRLKLICF